MGSVVLRTDGAFVWSRKDRVKEAVIERLSLDVEGDDCYTCVMVCLDRMDSCLHLRGINIFGLKYIMVMRKDGGPGSRMSFMRYRITRYL